jgi:hypothetical protein
MTEGERALERWLHAVNGRGQLVLTEAAVAEGVRVERLGFGSQRGVLVELFEGPQAVNAWLARTREVVHFELAAIACDEARYLVRVEGESWLGGGTWRWQLAADGRLAWLQHQPDDLSSADGTAAEEHRHQHKGHQPET